MQQLQITETLRPEQVKRGRTLQVRSQYEHLPAKTKVRVVRILQLKDGWFVRVVCGLTSNAKNIMRLMPITALELCDENIPPITIETLSKEKKRQLIAEAKLGDLKEVAMRYGITIAWLKRMLKEAELRAHEIAKLKGSENLPTRQRNLLLRMKYQSVQEVRQAIQSGKLHEGSTFGLGGKNFVKIVTWAFPEKEKQESQEAA